MDLFPNNKYTSSPELTSLKEDSELEVIKNEEELQKKKTDKIYFLRTSLMRILYLIPR